MKRRSERFKYSISLGLALLFSGGASPLTAQENPAGHVLWSDSPLAVTADMAKSLRQLDTHWSKNVYPVGNGRLGFTVFGDPELERIQFNEDSLWVGNEDHTGGYQPFGDIYIETGHETFEGYHRSLDISRAVQTVRYASEGVTYQREYFVSYPAQVGVIRLTASERGKLSGTIWLDSLHRSKFAASQGHSPKSMAAIQTTAKDNILTLKGESKDLFWWPVVVNKGLRGREYVSQEIINLDYEAQVRVLHKGGHITTEGDKIVFENCDSLTLLLAADTNYLNQREKGWTTSHPHERITAQLDAASARSYDALLAEHGPKVDEATGEITIVEGHINHLDGVSYDQQMCWDLFNNTIEAATVLGVDEELREELRVKRDKLLGPQIGRWGQLQEWMKDIDDPDSRHRHVSHMLAVYPGRQIHPTTTPEFAEAAKVSVLARGDGKTGWSKVL